MRWFARNPVMTVALVAVVVRFGAPLVSDGFGEGALGALWTAAALALAPFSAVATWVDPFFSRFPELVDIIGTLVLGLVPYAAMDAVYRRLGRFLTRRPGGVIS
jgi:hypothetical protein